MAQALLKTSPVNEPVERTTRNQESRENEVIHEASGSDEWSAPMMTNAPLAREGYVQRWVRTSVLGTEDVSNVMRKQNEGWFPRAADTVQTGFFAPVVNHARYGNIISNGDCILMERQLKKHGQQKAFIEQLTRNQTSGIERYLSSAIPGGHGFSSGEVEKFERKVTTGRRPKIADD